MCAMRKIEIDFFSVVGRESREGRDSPTTQILVTMDCRVFVFASESCRHRLEPLQRTMESILPRYSLAQASLGVITAVGIL